MAVRSVDHSTSWTQASLSVQLKWSDTDDNSKSAGSFTTLKSLKTGIWQLLRGGFVKMSLQPFSLGFYLLWSEANFCFKIKQSVKGIYTQTYSQISENFSFHQRPYFSLTSCWSRRAQMSYCGICSACSRPRAEHFPGSLSWRKRKRNYETCSCLCDLWHKAVVYLHLQTRWSLIYPFISILAGQKPAHIVWSLIFL